ncbi:MAG: hypothetical protein DWQ37_20140 [Planctomycetota bacterium]|nr:MAG: hypothetical protein DWQ37_20140 [Planctomycetota bacterium]
MLTERDFTVVRTVARYYLLNRPQIQRMCFPDDKTGRITRRRLQVLVTDKLIHRLRVLVHHPRFGSPGPVYFPSRKGCEFLAEHYEDERFLASCTQSPQPHHVLHWLAVSDTHMVLNEAIARQSQVHLAGWFNEWDVVNVDESAPERRFRLYTLLRESPRLVCAPDAAFMLSVGEHRKVFYVEQDRNTSGARQVAASKTPGYTALAEQFLHRRHFPDTTFDTFSVLAIVPTPRRRDALRGALRKALRDKPGASLWKLAAATDLSPEAFLFSPVFYPVDGEPVSLVRNDPESIRHGADTTSETTQPTHTTHNERQAS